MISVNQGIGTSVPEKVEKGGKHEIMMVVTKGDFWMGWERGEWNWHHGGRHVFEMNLLNACNLDWEENLFRIKILINVTLF